MKQKRKHVDSTGLGKDGIWSGDSQDMLSIAYHDQKRRKPILSLEVLRKVAATVRAIKQRLASEERNSGPEQITCASHGRSGNGDDQSGKAPGPNRSKNMEEKS